MSSPLVPCPGCSRHVRAAEPACPFCAAPLGPAVDRAPSGAQATRVVVALAAALTAGASLAACYGGPPHPQGYTPPTSQQPPAPAAPSGGAAPRKP